jgi:phenylpropionate dioxygenase-like ring-hydroxylating dioxygenase large terminal subunit
MSDYPALPSSWYTDPRIFGLERERIFERTWQCVGVADQLGAPGDFLSATVGRVPVVILRGTDGELRGFVNVCRHRCAEVVSGTGNRQVLQCPYHAWTYDLDGRLVSAPRSGPEPFYETEDVRLEPVSVATLGPFVFANLDRAATSLEDQLEGLEERMRKDGLDFTGLVYAGHDEAEIQANWKVLVENFNECYHCATAHPAFSRVVEVSETGYHLEHGTWTSRAVTELRRSRTGGERSYPYEVDGENDRGQFALLWPTFTLSQTPGMRRVVSMYIVPLSPNRTRTVCDTYVDPGMSAERIEQAAAFSSQVAKEDEALVESVQRGLESGRVRQGRLMLPSEQLVWHFQQLVRQAIGLDTPAELV